MIKKIILVFVLAIVLNIVYLSTPIAVAAADSDCFCKCSDNTCGGQVIANQSGKVITSLCFNPAHCDGKQYQCVTTQYECDLLTPAKTATSHRLTDPLQLKDDISNLWARIIKALLGFVAIASLVTFVYAGFMFLTSTGNAEKVKKAKDIIIYAVLGIFISIASYTILSFILKTLESI